MALAMPQLKSVPLSSTDLLKLVGIAAFLIDHIGLYFLDDDQIWRLFGRIAAPIFFFLIGFAKSRHIPKSWILWGCALTALDGWIDGWDELTLNILLNFALLRLILRGVDLWAQTPLRLVLLAGLAILSMPVADPLLEYGAEGWLWALLGYAQRLWRDGDDRFLRPRFLLALIALTAYVMAEIHHHHWDHAMAYSLSALLCALTAWFLSFARHDISWRDAPIMAAPLAWIARYSLEIYAISLFVMQEIAYVTR